MKPGRRALGVAESYRGSDDGARSTLAGAVVRTDGILDGLVAGTCTVGGTDATAAIVDCWERLDRPDVRYLLLAGVALAWYNVVDLRALHEATERPVLAVTFEDGDDLAAGIARAFEGEARGERLERHEALPERRRVTLPAAGEDEPAVFVRSVGIDDETADEVLEAYTRERRPEPLRIAAIAARGIDDLRRRETP